MLPSFASDVVTRVRPVWTTDARNNRVPDYGPNAGRLAVDGAIVQPGASAEVLGGRGADAVLIRWTVYLPPGSDVAASDAVEYDGVRYAVNGEPQRVKSPTGALSHVLVLLVDWKR